MRVPPVRTVVFLMLLLSPGCSQETGRVSAKRNKKETVSAAQEIQTASRRVVRKGGRNMQYGVCCGPEMARVAARAGFDYVEMGVGSLLKPRENSGAFADALEETRAAGLPCPVLNVIVPGDLKITGETADLAALRQYVTVVLRRAREAGVERVISIALSAADTQAAIALAQRFPAQVRATAGIHPHEAAQVQDSDFEQVRQALDHPSVVALGEVGLDYHYDFAPRGVQQAVFARQLEWLRERDLPVVVHCREAWDDTLALLREHGLSGRRVVFHCYSGSAEQYAVLQSEGWWASFTGVVTFRRAVDLQQIARSCPIEELMIETDAPYLAPVPLRGHWPNEPAYLVHIARFLAELRGADYETLATQMTANTERFFRL